MVGRDQMKEKEIKGKQDTMEQKESLYNPPIPAVR